VRLFGLIGSPLSHSFSEKYFTEKFQRENISDAQYKLFPIDSIKKLPELIKANPDLVGLNVTIPYKEQLIPYLHELDSTASNVGAVNTIHIFKKFDKYRWTEGFNTDVHGFRQSIKPFLTSSHYRAIILGTGGASKAVEFVLKQIGVECILVSREPNEIPGKAVATYGSLHPIIVSTSKLIVNCTPVGTFPNVNEFPDLPYEAIGKEHLLYDLVYNPAETEFMKKGKAQGAQVMNGMDMLKMQAEKAWEIWNSKI
jgi:shikimate dehydrogenase